MNGDIKTGKKFLLYWGRDMLTFLANIGASMIREPSPGGKAHDIEAICQIAKELLDNEDLVGI
jgi:hypothetical protein